MELEFGITFFGGCIAGGLFEQSQCAKLLAENKWLKEAINKNSKEMIRRGIEIERLKSQNKLMLTALLCLPRVDDATLSPEVCKVCRHADKCEDCLIDAAIREGMGG